MRSEWGGCLPLERHPKRVPRFERGFDSLALNSGRSAVYAALLDSGAHAAWLPAWLCPTVREFLVERRIEVREYHVGPDFLPLCDGPADGELLVWTNWLGCMPASAKAEVFSRFGGRLVYDNCHAYFEPPVRGAYNVYSCRKFLGVPHGAFLVAESLDAGVSPVREAALSGLGFLEEAGARGSNAVYGKYLAHEKDLSEGYLAMNAFVACAIGGVDEDGLAALRRANFDVLRRRLGKHVPPNMDLDALSPVWFPFYIEAEGLRENLIARRVFVPRLWKRTLSDPGATPVELDMARWLLPLPVDQRYTPDDMAGLADAVEASMDRSGISERRS